MHSTYPKRPPHFPSTPSSPTHLPPRINSSLLDPVPHLDLKLWSMRRAPLRGSWRMWGWSLGFGQPRIKSSAFIGVSTKQWSFLKYPCAEERGTIIDSSANPVVWCTFLGSYAGMWQILVVFAQFIFPGLSLCYSLHHQDIYTTIRSITPTSRLSKSPLPSNSKFCTISDCTPTEFRHTSPLTNPTNREVISIYLPITILFFGHLG